MNVDNRTTDKEANSSTNVVDDTRLLVLTLLSRRAAGEPERVERVFKLHKKRVVLGSMESADIRLVGDGVAPIHAVLELAADPAVGAEGATIYDLASDTGLFVNGAKTVTQVLKSGDEITIGRYTLKFALDDVSKITQRDRVREAGGRKLFLNPQEDLSPLLLQDNVEVTEIFDYRGVHRPCLEAVMSWKGTILDVEHFVSQKEVTLGASRKNSFAIPPIFSSDRYPLVTRVGEEFVLNLDAQMAGVVQRQGRLQPLKEILGQSGTSGSVALKRDEFAKVSVRDIDFYLSYSSAPPRMKMPRMTERDPLFFKIFLSSMLLTAVILIALINTRVPQAIEAEQIPERIATILYQPEKFSSHRKPIALEQKKPEPAPTPVATTAPAEPKVTKLDITPSSGNQNKPVPKEMSTSGAQGKKTTVTGAKPKAQKYGQNEAKEGKGARAKGKEGLRGTPKAVASNEHQTKAARPAPEGGKGAGNGNSEVADQGNVDLLRGAGSKIQNLLGNSAMHLGKGGEKLKGFGGFDTQGGGGLALAGTGTGGGGDSALAGGLADKGRGGGRIGTGLGAAGSGTGIVGGKTRVVIRSGGPEEAVVMGAIDADAVEAALNAHRDEFRNCYEREINAEHPDLSGRIGTSFVIGSSGRVNQCGIESTTLKNANVEGCVLSVIRRIQFPIPRGGGIVQVAYPFKFSSKR